MLVGGLTEAGGPGRACTLLDWANTVGALMRATGVRTMLGLLTDVDIAAVDTTAAVGAPALGPTLTIWYCPVSVLTRR